MKFKLLFFLVVLSVFNVSAGNRQPVIVHKSWSADNGSPYSVDCQGADGDRRNGCVLKYEIVK